MLLRFWWSVSTRIDADAKEDAVAAEVNKAEDDAGEGDVTCF